MTFNCSDQNFARNRGADAAGAVASSAPRIRPRSRRPVPSDVNGCRARANTQIEPPEPNRDPWTQAEDDFIRAKRSVHTRRAYREVLDAFFGFAHVHPRGVDSRHVIDWRDELESRCAPATVAQRLAALAGYYRWCRACGLSERDPAALVARPRVRPYRRARWLTAAEARRLLAAPDATSLHGMRDRAVLWVLLTSGLRRAEVVSLRVGDVTVIGGRRAFRVITKGGDEHVRDLPEPAWDAVQSYLDARASATEAKAPLFTRVESTGEPRPLSGEAVCQLVARANACRS